MHKIIVKDTCIETTDTGKLISIIHKGVHWDTDGEGMLETAEGTIAFSDADTIETQEFETGTAKGIRTCYTWLNAFSFATIISIDTTSEDVYFEWIPLMEDKAIQKVNWPASFTLQEEDSWSLLPLRQGLYIPYGWKNELKPLPFDGMFLTAGCYMPWFAQGKGKAGYIAISLTPWDAGVKAEHKEEGSTALSQWMTPTLGKMDYRRIIRYTFRDNADIASLCSIYRQFVKEQGKLTTLKEKALRNPKVNDLVGSAFVHFGIKAVVQKESRFYDAEHPENNAALIPFAKRAEEIQMLRKLGATKMYLHLDGWAEPGYDNCHPDYYPACIEAGGWEGMKKLEDVMHETGGLFGIHDQYRDYYKKAPSFDEANAIMLEDGKIFEQAIWAGGEQSYLCASLAPSYVRRNFALMHNAGITLDGAYLDVFTCNEGDECYNPYHRMSRKDCYEYRRQCFAWLMANGILSSSEEVSDWAVTDLVFAHYAPYEEQMLPPGTPAPGIPVPLFSLVYHDCLIVPWIMDKTEDRDNMLFALLNGGAPYLIREGAYPDVDGAFARDPSDIGNDIARCHVVQKLHERIAFCRMTDFALLNKEGTRQRAVYEDGTVVEIDLDKGTYALTEAGNVVESADLMM